METETNRPLGLVYGNPKYKKGGTHANQMNRDKIKILENNIGELKDDLFDIENERKYWKNECEKLKQDIRDVEESRKYWETQYNIVSKALETMLKSGLL